MATTTASSFSASAITMGLRAVAIVILALLLSSGVMTMKMISTTSITSTMGVTLISDTGGGAFFNCISCLLELGAGGNFPRRWGRWTAAAAGVQSTRLTDQMLLCLTALLPDACCAQLN